MATTIYHRRRVMVTRLEWIKYIYGISVIDSVHFSRGIFTPYYFYGKEVMQNKD